MFGTDGTTRSTDKFSLAAALKRTNQDENSIEECDEGDEDDEEGEDKQCSEACDAMLEDKCQDSDTPEEQSNSSSNADSSEEVDEASV